MKGPLIHLWVPDRPGGPGPLWLDLLILIGLWLAWLLT